MYSHPKNPVSAITWSDAILFCNKLSLLVGKRPYYNISIIRHTFHYERTLKKVRKKEVWVENRDKMIFENNIAYSFVQINSNANGFRLPLEKEWEYAAKAGTNNRWAGTNDPKKLVDFANFRDNPAILSLKILPVKSKLPNEWGFYDMSGSVWEWCYDRDVKRSDDIHYTQIYRGGSCSDLSSLVRIDVSSSTLTDTKYPTVGFRIALSNIK